MTLPFLGITNRAGAAYPLPAPYGSEIIFILFEIVLAINQTGRIVISMNSTKEIPQMHESIIALLEKAPSLAKWAQDKVQTYFEGRELLEDNGKFYRSHNWYFNGKFGRRQKETHLHTDDWKATVSVTCRGGEYRGQKQSVQVSYTYYELVK